MLFERILDNLLGNAVFYADQGGVITIHGEAAPPEVRFTVSNPAAGLDAGDMPLLFNRFWRKDEARSNVGEHCGLGLSVVKRAVALMGGHIDAALDPQGMFSVTIRLPAAQLPGQGIGHE